MDNSKHKQSSPQPPQPPVASDKTTPRPTPLADQMPTPLAAADPAVTAGSAPSPQPLHATPQTQSTQEKVASPANQPSSPGTPYRVPPKKKSRAILWGSIAAILLLLIIAIAVVVVILFSGPSKKDYAEMQRQTEQAVFAYHKVNSAGTEEIEQQVNDYKSKTSVLKDAKALKDKEVREAYKAFTKQNDPYTKIVTDQFVTHRDAIQTLRYKCHPRVPTSESGIERYQSTLKACREANQTLEKVDGEIGEAAKKTTELYKKHNEAVSALQEAYKQKDQAAATQAQQQVRSTAREMMKQKSPILLMRSSLAKHDPIKNLNALGQLLQEKQKKK